MDQVSVVAILPVVVSGFAFGSWLQRRQWRGRVARASHDLRRTLQMIGLEATGSTGNPARAVAMAGSALADLEALAGIRRSAHGGDFDPGQLIATVCDRWRPVARAAGMDIAALASPTDCRARGSRAEVERSLENLIANAIEHGAENDGVVSVRTEARGTELALSVWNKTSGTPVGRVSGRTRFSRGHGIAIARDLARRQGGELRAGREGGGFRAQIALPAIPLRTEAGGATEP